MECSPLNFKPRLHHSPPPRTWTSKPEVYPSGSEYGLSAPVTPAFAQPQKSSFNLAPNPSASESLEEIHPELHPPSQVDSGENIPALHIPPPPPQPRCHRALWDSASRALPSYLCSNLWAICRLVCSSLCFSPLLLIDLALQGLAPFSWGWDSSFPSTLTRPLT